MNKYSEAGSEFGFEDLELYQVARAFRNRVFKLIKLLPGIERNALVGQMNRAAVSLTNNIAEGYGRHNRQENIQFCRISRGSLMELIDDINVCLDKEYAKQEHLDDLRKDAACVLRLLNGFISYLKKQKDQKRQTNLPENKHD
ncbi:MAG: four helix bundle protein [Planctomycetaceae bacterium]|nr:MAG: four helix bundle protein [Planctomycetaceae bacterium]